MKYKVGKYTGETMGDILSSIEREYPFKKGIKKLIQSEIEYFEGSVVIYTLGSIGVMDYAKKAIIIDKDKHPYRYTVIVGDKILYDVYNVNGLPHYEYTSEFSEEKVQSYLVLMYKCLGQYVVTSYEKGVQDKFAFTSKKKISNLLDAINIYTEMFLTVNDIFKALPNENGLCISTLVTNGYHYQKLYKNSDVGGSVLASTLDFLYLKIKYKYTHELRGLVIFKRNQMSVNKDITSLCTVGRRIEDVSQLRRKMGKL